jgi:hypothetical protein
VKEKIVSPTSSTRLARVQTSSVVRTDGEKHYDTDWAKAKVHAMLGEMLDKTLLTFKRPEDIRVLHFAGIDAQETKAVYLSRGIPPENITTLEQDPIIARGIEALGLGIKVINMTLKDYVIEQVTSGKRFKYDIISLDFTGPLSLEIEHTIRTAVFELSGNNFLFHSANLLKRDKNSLKTYLHGVRSAEKRKHHESTSMNSISPSSIPSLESVMGSVMQGVDNFLVSQTEGASSRLKAQYYPHVVESMIKGGVLIAKGYEFIRFLYGSEFDTEEPRIVSRYNKLVNKAEQINSFRELLEEAQKTYDPFIMTFLEDIISRRIRSVLERYGLGEPSVGKLIEGCLQDVSVDRPAMSIRNHKHYSYISESGSPMVGSMFFTSKTRYLFDQGRELARACGFPNEFTIIDQSRFAIAFDKYVKQGYKESLRRTNSDSYEMQFLGNSSKPVLTKGRFLEELDNGLSIDEVRAKYRAWDGKPLAAWKAHHTMGTYKAVNRDASIRVEESIIVDKEDADAERITKEEAIELLSVGIPTDEIYDAYPTSFTKGQLRAFKAHITMRTYKRD